MLNNKHGASEICCTQTPLIRFRLNTRIQQQHFYDQCKNVDMKDKKCQQYFVVSVL